MAIAFNAATNPGLNTNNFSHTCSSGSNRLLIVGLFMDSSDGGPSVTYNSVAMTKVATSANNVDRAISLFYLLAPATGANTVTVSWVSAPGNYHLVAADYTGVQQSAQPDGFATTTPDGTTSMTATVTVTASNCWMVAVGRDNSGGTVTYTAPGSMGARLTTGSGLSFADSAGTISTGSIATTATLGGANLYKMIAASFAPATGGTDADISAFRHFRESGQRANLRRRASTDHWKKNGLLYVPKEYAA